MKNPKYDMKQDFTGLALINPFRVLDLFSQWCRDGLSPRFVKTSRYFPEHNVTDYKWEIANPVNGDTPTVTFSDWAGDNKILSKLTIETGPFRYQTSISFDISLIPPVLLGSFLELLDKHTVGLGVAS